MKLAKALATVLIPLGLASCASQADLGTMRRDMDDLKVRLMKGEREIAGLRDEAKEGIDRSVKSSQKDLDSLRRSDADLQASLEGVKVDMQVLSGKLDDISQLAKKPAEDITLLKEDLERRLTGLDEKIAKLSKDFDAFNQKLAEKEKEAERNPDVMYRKGLDLVKNGDGKQAREVFKKFLEAYPKNELAANVHYWLGETWYLEKNFEQAILEFQEVIKNFPGKEKVPAAMLKQGMAFKELNDASSAKYVYKKLVEDFPASEEAKKAKDKLKDM